MNRMECVRMSVEEDNGREQKERIESKSDLQKREEEEERRVALKWNRMKDGMRIEWEREDDVERNEWEE